MVTIVIADDHKVLRQGLRLLIEAEPGFRVVGEAEDGLTALELVGRLMPDVLVADISMPALNGLEVTRQVRRLSPRTRVIVLSMHASEEYVLQALKYGSAGYVLKAFGAEDLIAAMREVLAGRRYLSPPLSHRALDAYAERAESFQTDGYESLTTREREILQLTAEGQPSTVVAQRLCISPRTVESHRASVMRKLRLRNQSELIRYALDRRIIA